MWLRLACCVARTLVRLGEIDKRYATAIKDRASDCRCPQLYTVVLCYVGSHNFMPICRSLIVEFCVGDSHD